MLRPADTLPVYLYLPPVDMRKSIDGLSALVEAELSMSPMQAAVFVFCNRGRDKIKLLLWERNGFIVWYKRLEAQRFCWPTEGCTGHRVGSGRDLNALLDGLDIWTHPAHREVTARAVV